MARRGFFVTLEGLDGCGKTTQVGTLAERLRGRGLDPVIAQEPGGTRLGRSIRSMLLDSTNSDLHPHAELLLYFASRVQNLAEVIQPALASGHVVICDRFTDATVAYQGYGRELGTERVLQLNAITCWNAQPDLTVWLDIDPQTALERARVRNASQAVDEGRMESQELEFFQRVRQGYASIRARHPERVRHVEASGSRDEVARRVFDAVLPSLSEFIEEGG